MILSRPATGQAFEQLIAALDAEAQELNQLGSKVALQGNARNAAKVLKLAGERARLRDHLRFLHGEWQQVEPANLEAVTARVTGPAEIRPAQKSPLNRSVKGLTLAEAASKLAVKPAQVKTWISQGKLTAYQKVGGTWKILQSDLAEFYRQHRSEL